MSIEKELQKALEKEREKYVSGSQILDVLLKKSKNDIVDDQETEQETELETEELEKTE